LSGLRSDFEGDILCRRLKADPFSSRLLVSFAASPKHAGSYICQQFLGNKVRHETFFKTSAIAALFENTSVIRCALPFLSSLPT
jgi:hypothetical protein